MKAGRDTYFWATVTNYVSAATNQQATIEEL
jgi:hypothetical protein